MVELEGTCNDHLVQLPLIMIHKHKKKSESENEDKQVNIYLELKSVIKPLSVRNSAVRCQVLLNNRASYCSVSDVEALAWC